MATGYFIVEIPLFDSPGQTTTAKSAWVRVGHLLSPTVVVQGLEAGGTISIRVSNGKPGVFPDVTDDGSPHTTLGAVTSNTGAAIGGAFTYIRAEKTQGGSPTATTVILQAQAAK